MQARHGRLYLAALVCATLPALAQAQERETSPLKARWTYDPASLRPFWLGDTMIDETALFVRTPTDTRPTASLLFQPTAIVSVRSASREATYEAGRDYVWKPGTRTIELPEGSRIVWKTPADLRRKPGSQPFALTHRDGHGEILFAAGHEYQDMQTVITYRHKRGAWTGPMPAYQGDRLAHTLTRLKAKGTLKIALLGDSISTGCNASGWANVPPYQPPWQDLFVLWLRRTFGASVALQNFAVGGTDTAWGVQQIGRVIDAAPDLVILAFGMNDAAGRPAAEYGANMKAMVDAVRRVRPDAEFILVAPMVGNRDWVALRQELFPQYRDELARLAGPSVALADMTSIWAELLKHKLDWDMTGNGVNHPNDFGHRVYAQVLASLVSPNPAR